MGSHFAPRQETHGLPSFPEHHIGDLGNIEIRDDGSGRLEIVARDANLRKDDALSFRDRAIVVHERADKGKPPPSGDSGKPIACGVIQADD
jgi:Cu-Zn family superoxide dismutase